MIVKIADVCLYTGEVENLFECTLAKAWLQKAGIKFKDLWYGDPSQHEDCIAPLRSWFPPDQEIGGFPFIIYTEIHDDLEPSEYPRFIINGLKDIENSNLVELWQLGR